MRASGSMVTIACVSVLTAPLAAQNRIAFVPFAGYGLPGTLAEDNANDIHLEPAGALLLGGALEFRLSGTFAVSVEANRTFGQTLEIVSSGSTQFEEDVAMMQFVGSIVVRPGRRRMSGDLSPLFIELGGGVTLYNIGDALRPGEDFDGVSPVAFVGTGYNFPLHSHARLQVFARAQTVLAYSSDGVDAYNQPPLPTSVKGSAMLNVQVGVGLRVGP